MDFVEIRTALIPEGNFLDTVLGLAGNLPSDERIFAIDNIKFIPHITIYDAEYPKENINKIFEVSQDFIKFLPLNLMFEKFTASFGYIGLGFKKTPEVYSFHKKVVEALNPFRNGHIRSKYGNNPNELVVKYGYHLVMDLFGPHLTLGRYKTDEQAKEITASLDRNILPNFSVSKFAHAETGDNGTVTKILKSYSGASS